MSDLAKNFTMQVEIYGENVWRCRIFVAKCLLFLVAKVLRCSLEFKETP